MWCTNAIWWHWLITCLHCTEWTIKSFAMYGTERIQQCKSSWTEAWICNLLVFLQKFLRKRNLMISNIRCDDDFLQKLFFITMKTHNLNCFLVFFQFEKQATSIQHVRYSQMQHVTYLFQASWSTGTGNTNWPGKENLSLGQLGNTMLQIMVSIAVKKSTKK